MPALWGHTYTDLFYIESSRPARARVRPCFQKQRLLLLEADKSLESEFSAVPFWGNLRPLVEERTEEDKEILHFHPVPTLGVRAENGAQMLKAWL